jgi:Arc/MetJ-type ribon-helix-helix transcriptional regulator
MTIDLSGDRAAAVRSLMEAGHYASEDEVIDDALRLLTQRYQAIPAHQTTPSVTDRARQQAENFRRLCRTLDAMPTAEVADGLTNRDHDQILYGRRP